MTNETLSRHRARKNSDVQSVNDHLVKFSPVAVQGRAVFEKVLDTAQLLPL